VLTALLPYIHSYAMQGIINSTRSCPEMLLHFHCNNGYENVPQCYAKWTLFISFWY